MAWRVKVDILESCSCAQVCPCILGPAKPDQEWCSGIFGLRVTEGSSDGVDLSGAKIVVHFELPGDFLGGMDKSKLYLDTGLSEAQRREIDAIFHGERGGLWGGMKESIKQWLPSTVADIDFRTGDAPGVTVAGIGEVVLQPLKTESGKPSIITDAPLMEAFSMKSEHLANATGTKFSDPALRAWESLGAGGISSAEWSG